MKYYIKVNNTTINSFAGHKACKDVNIILEKMGYKALDISMPVGNRKLFFIKVLIQYIIIFFTLKSKDEVFIQYPYYTQYPHILYKFILLKKTSIKLIIHDLNSIRYPGEEEYLPILQKASLIIAHTPAMEDFLRKKLNIKCPIKHLYLFDYFINKPCKIKSDLALKIVYAGNLSNNHFLEKIKIPTFAYGKSTAWISNNNNVSYEGFFQAEDLSNLKGDWGLIWYGNETSTCDNIIGEYLYYISSHKCSLYLAAEKPIIIWKKTSLGAFVEQQHIGFTINSLDEIYPKIKKLTEEEKNIIRTNVKRIATEIRGGKMLENLLKTSNYDCF